MANSLNQACLSVPPAVSGIIKTLNDNNFKAYLAGGSVRDFLLGKTPSDYDIATSAKPDEVKKLFPRVFDTGIAHGTVTVIKGGCHTEVTTFRADGEYADNRRPASVTFINDIKADLSRRDFTVNALAYHPDAGILDFFGGVADINQKIIRCVGAPDARFGEDALRMMRAVRFAAVLGFAVERETERAIAKCAPLLKNVSAERVRDEFLKIITSANPNMLNLLIKHKLLKFFSEALFDYVKRHKKSAISGLRKSPKDAVSCLCVLLRFADGAFIRQSLKQLRLDNKTAERVSAICGIISGPLPANMYETRRALSRAGAEVFSRALDVKRALSGRALARNYSMLARVLKNNDCVSLKTLNINGHDLARMGVTGKATGEVLNALLDFVMRSPKGNKNEILTKKAAALL